MKKLVTLGDNFYQVHTMAMIISSPHTIFVNKTMRITKHGLAPASTPVLRSCKEKFKYFWLKEQHKHFCRTQE
jgi:hypothetical protein